jgi:hypothetical protein
MDKEFRTKHLAVDRLGPQGTAAVTNHAEIGFTIGVLIETIANGAFPQEKPHLTEAKWGTVIVKTRKRG